MLQLADGPLHVSANPIAADNVHARRADDRARHELRAAAQRRHAQVHPVPVRRHRRGGRADHGGHRRDQLARLGGGHASALLKGETLLRSPLGRSGRELATARAAADRARPAGAGARPGERAARARREPDQLGAGSAAPHPAPGPEGRRGADRLQPRALHPHAAQGQRDRDPAPGERPGDRAGAGDARLLRHLDRARRGQRRPRDGRRERPRDGAARASPPTASAASGCREEEEQGYYYGFANEGLWPLCHIAHTRPVFRAPDWEHYRDGQPALRRRGRRGGAAPRTRSSWCRTTTSRCCRA